MFFRTSHKKEYLNNPGLYEQNVNNMIYKLFNRGVNPVVITTQFYNHFASFFLFLADLKKRNLVNFSQDFEYIYYFADRNYYLNGYDLEIFNLLEYIRTFCMNKGLMTQLSGNCYLLPLKNLSEFFWYKDDTTFCSVIKNRIFNLYFQDSERNILLKEIEEMGSYYRELPHYSVPYSRLLNSDNILDMVGFLFHVKEKENKRFSSPSFRVDVGKWHMKSNILYDTSVDNSFKINNLSAGSILYSMPEVDIFDYSITSAMPRTLTLYK